MTAPDRQAGAGEVGTGPLLQLRTGRTSAPADGRSYQWQAGCCKPLRRRTQARWMLEKRVCRQPHSRNRHHSHLNHAVARPHQHEDWRQPRLPQWSVKRPPPRWVAPPPPAPEPAVACCPSLASFLWRMGCSCEPPPQPAAAAAGQVRAGCAAAAVPRLQLWWRPSCCASPSWEPPVLRQQLGQCHSEWHPVGCRQH